MKWELISYNRFPGKYNMDFDLNLVNQSKPDTAILRFYGWNPYCISIGANQSFNDINVALANNNNIDVVKRPTGGRAILHADELTYSIVLPAAAGFNGKEAYERISTAIICGLKKYHPALDDVILEAQQPDFPKLLKDSGGSICFASTAKSEIKFNGKKLVGSAQRIIGSTLLQHGSILLGAFHENLVDYLNVTLIEKEKLRKNIAERTTNISQIIGSDINIQELQENIIFGFQKILSANFTAELISSSGYNS